MQRKRLAGNWVYTLSNSTTTITVYKSFFISRHYFFYVNGKKIVISKLKDVEKYLLEFEETGNN